MRKRHKMKHILLLSNNDNAQVLYDKIKNKGYEVSLVSDKVTASMIDEMKPDFVISYNYMHIVKEDVIDKLGDRIINLHISLLPWNKGASPNIWSFIDDTPKGVTIHRLEKGLDTGKIIEQKEIFFDENVETLASTYDTLNTEIVNLLIDNWEKIVEGKYEIKEQAGTGTYHRTADLKALLDGREIDYDMTIAEFKRFVGQKQ